MKVKDLIQQLKKVPEDSDVQVSMEFRYINNNIDEFPLNFEIETLVQDSIISDNKIYLISKSVVNESDGD